MAFPVKARRRTKPTRRGIAFWAVGADGAVLLRRRPLVGLLGGMMEIPSTGWRETRWTVGEARRLAPAPATWRRLPGVVRHSFTHFNLELTVLAGCAIGEGEIPLPSGSVWCPLGRLADYALPSLMKKVVRHAVDGGAANGRGVRQRAAPSAD